VFSAFTKALTIAGRISEKVVTLIGGGLFILFGAIAIFEA
jgi:putative Ca2+/H+ antiporter (TMEM165/GDT1 family)